MKIAAADFWRNFEAGMDFSSVIKEDVISSTPVSGGDIGRSFRVKTAENEYFVKYYSKPGLAGLEAHGLAAMSECGCVSLPELAGYDEHMLVLFFLKQGARTADFQSRLGRELAPNAQVSRRRAVRVPGR